MISQPFWERQGDEVRCRERPRGGRSNLRSRWRVRRCRQQFRLEVREPSDEVVDRQVGFAPDPDRPFGAEQAEHDLAVLGEFGIRPEVTFHPGRLPRLEPKFQIGVDQLSNAVIGDSIASHSRLRNCEWFRIRLIRPAACGYASQIRIANHGIAN